MPQCAEALVDVVRLLLPRAGRSRTRAPAALAPGEINHPEARVLALLADKLDLRFFVEIARRGKHRVWQPWKEGGRTPVQVKY